MLCHVFRFWLSILVTWTELMSLLSAAMSRQCGVSWQRPSFTKAWLKKPLTLTSRLMTPLLTWRWDRLQLKVVRLMPLVLELRIFGQSTHPSIALWLIWRWLICFWYLSEFIGVCRKLGGPGKISADGPQEGPRVICWNRVDLCFGKDQPPGWAGRVHQWTQ